MSGANGSPPPAHAHSYDVQTKAAEEHRHEIYGFTFPVNGRASDSHVHSYQGISEISSGHTHRYYGTTGPAVPSADGSHIHALSGNTNRESQAELPLHFHSYSGKSGSPIGTEPPDW